MKTKIYDIRDREEYRAAMPFDLIKLIPADGNHAHYKYKYALEIMIFGICQQKSIHLSGPTGAGKSSMIEAITEEPENFRLLCEYSGIKYKPPLLYEIEMVQVRYARGMSWPYRDQEQGYSGCTLSDHRCT